MPTNLTDRWKSRRIVVLGDLMLDRFIYGHVRRVSPEAPVPVLLKERETLMLGGAGNVARNISALGGIAILVGVVGDDHAGSLVHEQIAADPGIRNHVITVPGIPTTEKIRYVSQQQLLRVDHERPTIVAADIVKAALDAVLEEADAMVLSDYAKGVLQPEILQYAIMAARKRNIAALVDPKARDLTRYNGASLLTPNRNEAEAFTGLTMNTDEQAALTAQSLLDNSPDTAAVVITRSEKGMTLLERGKLACHLKTEAREISDVSGAGDTVLATLALGMAAFLPLSQTVHLANVAAGIAVSKLGTATVVGDELDRALRAERMHTAEDKIAPVDVASARATDWRSRGEIVGFTNGVFDLVHPGHISLLTQARGHCDRLIVGLNSDASVKRIKGPSRPVQDEVARAIVLASMTCVDMVVIFGEDTPLELIKLLRPNLLVKGQDYTVETVIGAREVHSWGGKVVLANLSPGKSTTATIQRMTEKL